MPKFAVHNIHCPSVEIDENGAMSHDGERRIVLGKPLHDEPFGSFEEAEVWRLERLGK